ncbi:uncharacterized protein LOC131665647 isoform X2 [Phymastichus coffea]|uniref:uncharacterized protein LOC131665647 isoform X2 n=1 Tax=Phymastichus coffea TaxID=108790 RepID=UPI00273A8DB5|nr:uncharacterized protein LOC131665647 isoform X2 [Phymastichus coffea]
MVHAVPFSLLVSEYTRVGVLLLQIIMKPIMVFFVLCCYCCLAVYASNVTMTNDERDENIQTCLATTRLSQVSFKSGDDTLKYLTEEQKSCFLACMFLKIGIIQYNGTVRSVTEETDITTANAIDKSEENLCKLAWCLHEKNMFGIHIIFD